jgi:hypothetical protein
MIPVRQPFDAAEQFAASTYRDRLQSWCIVRLLPDMQRVVIARFRRRSDAEAHLKVLRRIETTFQYVIIFEALPENGVPA